MTRIIAGRARGRRLAVPTGARPTADRVREALFASLDHQLGGFRGCRVLDLYAGSGALGLEAASRGAEQVVLVERDRASAAVARANAEVVAAGAARVVCSPVSAFLAGDPWLCDLVLVDPPYAMGGPELEEVLSRLAAGWLAPGAIVVVERPRRGGEFQWPPALAALRGSCYGATTLWYGRCATQGEDP